MGGGSYMSHIPSHAHKDARGERQFVSKFTKRKYEPKQRDREPTTYQNHYHQNGAYNRKGNSVER